MNTLETSMLSEYDEDGGIVNSTEIILSKDIHHSRLKIQVKRGRGQPWKEVLDVLLDGFKRSVGIVYVISPKNVDDLHQFLQNSGIQCSKYHGQLNSDEKDINRSTWMSSSNDVNIMVANGAFGMGINLRRATFVIHATLPLNLSSMFQEAGRCGRNNLPSSHLVLYKIGSMKMCRHLTKADNESYNMYWYVLDESFCKRVLQYQYYCTVDSIQHINENTCPNIQGAVPCCWCSNEENKSTTYIVSYLKPMEMVIRILQLCSDEDVKVTLLELCQFYRAKKPTVTNAFNPTPERLEYMMKSIKNYREESNFYLKDDPLKSIDKVDLYCARLIGLNILTSNWENNELQYNDGCQHPFLASVFRTKRNKYIL